MAERTERQLRDLTQELSKLAFAVDHIRKSREEITNSEFEMSKASTPVEKELDTVGRIR